MEGNIKKIRLKINRNQILLIVRVPEEEEEKGAKKIFNKIMATNCLNLMKDMNTKLQEHILSQKNELIC